MNVVLLWRLIGFIIFGIIGAVTGQSIHAFLVSLIVNYPLSAAATTGFSVLLFSLIGFGIAPWITIKPVQALRKLFNRSSPQALISGLIGLIVGLVIAAITAYPLSLLPSPVGTILPLAGLVIFAYLGVVLFVTRSQDFTTFFSSLTNRLPSRAKGMLNESERHILVDTSAIIDGRIADIVKTGFLGGSLIVPRFVLNELQYVSDSADSLRRQRGRRGMDVLSDLQQNEEVSVTISDIDVEGVREVDDRLVVLARQMHCPILTNDYNLNRIAELQGVKVLNINDLANAVKVILLPGETFRLQVIQEGKEFNQGVGYLDDGTMVVVENGQKYLNTELNVTVTKILQTSAGRMIFAKPEHNNN